MKKRSFFLILMTIILTTLPWNCPEGSSKKPSKQKSGAKQQSLPSSVPRKLSVLSDLDNDCVLQILRFINDETGLECSLVADDESTENFDVYIGSFLEPPSEAVHPYSSDLWTKIDNGIVQWSFWQSGIAFNDILLGEEGKKATSDAKQPNTLTGRICAIDPMKDKYTAAVLFTLFRKYGRQVLIYIDGNIPLYVEGRRQLIAAVENGRYTGVLTIDGYVIPARTAQYPIHIDYRALDSERFPVTSVRGFNTAFISNKTKNPRGSKHFIDFLASDRFRKFVRERFFYTPPYTENTPVFLPLMLEPGWFQAFSTAWKNIAYPEGIDDELLSELK